ncbi:MAG: DUF885 family protein, partial [Planctomycetota bacterium]
GRTPPRIAMAGAAEQVLALAGKRYRDDPAAHPTYRPLRRLGPDDPLAKRARAAIRQGVVPSFERLGVFLRDTYVPGCRTELGASRSVDGPELYRFRLRVETTTGLGAKEVHELGRREVARIRAEMMEVIARSDFPRKGGLAGDELFAAFVDHLRTDPRFYHRSADELLQGYRDIAKRVDAELPRLFGRLPRLTYGVRAMPDYLAPTAPTAYYYRGSLENGVPGYFVANTWRLDQRPRYEMIPLTLHEAAPGHHFQIALAQEMDGVHEWRRHRGYTAFVEGWALYAERLGLEMGSGERGFYSDPYDDFGRLTYEMWRALRLVVDTGIHAFGWSRERAVETMLRNSALSRENIEREVNRSIVWPGQATAYKIGELKIRELRERAERSLGDRFDRRAFHDHLLAEGALPLGLLEKRIDAWIAARRAG